MRRLLLLVLMAGCLCGCNPFRAPEAVQNGAELRSRAMGSFARNNALILEAVLEKYRQAEYRYAESLYQKDVDALLGLEGAGTLKAQDVVDTMQAAQRRLDENKRKINTAVHELRLVVEKAQGDLAIAVRLDKALREYYGTGVEMDAMEAAALQVIEMLRQRTQERGE